MSEYDELVKNLRDHQNGGRRQECEDAANAIQALQARVKELEAEAVRLTGLLKVAFNSRSADGHE